MLLFKVLSLLQDSDPPLARDIVKSRAAIWDILEDPKKFTRVQPDGRSNADEQMQYGRWPVAGVVMTGWQATSLAAENTPGDVPVAKDLTAVIALQGLPCGKVVSARQQGQDDYVACVRGRQSVTACS